MQDYYHRRASIYDASMGYDQPEVVRRHEPVIEYLARRFAKRSVLEIACGPGFWTDFLARSASAILATDFNEATLAEARNRNLPSNVTLRQADAYALPDFGRKFDACFACDWFCHVPVSKRLDFLEGLHAQLEPGAIVIFCDQMPRDGANNGQSDPEGNNIQIRTLPDGSRYEVIKNFPTRSELAALLSKFTTATGMVGFPDSRRYIVEYHLDK